MNKKIIWSLAFLLVLSMQGVIADLQVQGDIVDKPIFISTDQDIDLVTIQGPTGVYKLLGNEETFSFVPKESGVYKIIVSNEGLEIDSKEVIIGTNIEIISLGEEIILKDGYDVEINVGEDVFRTYNTSNSSFTTKLTELHTIRYYKQESFQFEEKYFVEPKKEVKINTQTSEGKLVVNTKKDIPKIKSDSKKIVVDTEELTAVRVFELKGEYENAELEIVSKGKKIYVCQDYNGNCNSGWKLYKNTFVGEKVKLSFNNNTAYAEIGLATINSIKPIYEVNERAEFLTAVLDSAGYLVSNATVSVQVIDPNGNSYDVSNTVIETSMGIYYSYFDLTTTEGFYTINVDAIGDGVDNKLSNVFLVQNDYEFDIIRNSPSSIDPFAGTHNTSFVIIGKNTNQTNVTVRESVPESFDIIRTYSILENGSYGPNASVIISGGRKIISWDSLPLNTTYFYESQAPLVSPELHYLGPIFVNNFEEARAWALASDPTLQDASLTANMSSVWEGNLITLTGNIECIGGGQAINFNFWPEDDNVEIIDDNTCTSRDFEWVSTAVNSCVSSDSCTASPTTARVDVVKCKNGGSASVTWTLRACGTGESLPSSNTITMDSNIADAFDLSTSVTITEVPDTQNPVVVIGNPVNNTFTNDNTPTFFYTPTDNRGFSSCSLVLNGVTNESNSTGIINGSLNSITPTLGNGNFIWTVSCTDTSSNTGLDDNRKNITIDTINPTQPSLLSPSNTSYINDLTPNFVWSQTTESNFENYTLLLDTTPSFSSPDQIIEITDISTTNYNLVSALSNSQKYYWKIIVYDKAKNSIESETYEFTTDITPPTSFSLVSPNNGLVSSDTTPLFDWGTTSETYFSNYTLQIDESFDFSSPIEYTVSSISASQFQIVSALSSDQLYYWRVIAFDLAKNQRHSSQNFTYETDNTNPVVTINNPVATYYSSNNISLEYQASDLNLDSCWYTINGGANNELNSCQNTTIIFSSGSNTLRVYANDTAGNLINDIVTFTVDLVNPVVVLNDPANTNYVTTKPFDFNYTPTDNNLDTCTLYTNNSGWGIDGSPLAATSGIENSFSRTYNDGYYTWNVRCTDLASRTSFAAGNYTFILDTVPPTVNLMSPDEGHTEINSNNLDFKYNVSDTTSSITQCSLYINGVYDQQQNNPAENTELDFLKNLNNGVYTWSVRCTDSAGFTTISEQRNITVSVVNDNDPPVIVLNDPGQGDYVATSNVFFNYTVSDSTGISQCSIYLDGQINQSCSAGLYSTNVQAESGFVYLSGTSGTITLDNSYNTSKTFIIRRYAMATQDANQEPDGGTATIELSNCTSGICNQITASRTASDGEDEVVSYSILQADNIRVWNFTLNWAGGEGSKTFVPSPALPSNYDSKCFVNIFRTTLVSSPTNSDFSDAEIRSNITSTTSVEFGRDGEDGGSPAAATSKGEVICFLDQTNVQQIFHSMTEGEPITDNVAISSVDLEDSWVTYNHRQPDNGVGQNSILANITSSTNLEFYVAETGQTAVGDQPQITAYVIDFENLGGGAVKNYRLTPSNTDQNITDSINQVNTSKSLLDCYNSMAAGGGTAHTRDYWGHAFDSSTSINSVNYRTRTTSQETLINCQVIEWPEYTTYNTGTSADSCTINVGSQNNFTISGVNDGQHSYAIECYDSSSNFNYVISQTNNFTVDGTIPYLTLESPISTTYQTTKNIPLSFSTYDTNPLTCYYSINNGLNNSINSCLNTTFNSLRGINNFTIYSRDTANNINSTSVQFTALTNSSLNVWYTPQPAQEIVPYTIYANYSDEFAQPITGAICTAYGDFDKRVMQVGYEESDALISSNAIYGSNILRVDVKNIPIANGYEIYFYAYRQTQTSNNLSAYLRCDGSYTTAPQYLVGQINTDYALAYPQIGKHKIDVDPSYVTSENCSIIFESSSSTLSNNWTITEINKTLSQYTYYSNNDGSSYNPVNNAFVDFGYDFSIINLTYNSSSGYYELNNIHSDLGGLYNTNISCIAEYVFEQNKTIQINVSVPSVPKVQIVYASPNPATYLVDDITIEWAVNSFGLGNNYLNITYPNGTLLNQYSQKEITVLKEILNTPGNYTATVYAEHSNDGDFNTTSQIFEVVDYSPKYYDVSVSPQSPQVYNKSLIIYFNSTWIDPNSNLANVYLENNFFGVLTNSTTTNISDVFFYQNTLPAGSFTYRWIGIDENNNTNRTQQYSFVINKENSSLTLTLDGINSDLVINETQILNITSTLNLPQSGTVYVYENGTLLGSGISPYSVLKNYTTPGVYNITSKFFSNQNYTATFAEHTLTVSDIIPPSITLVSPLEQETDLDGTVNFAYSVQDSGTLTNCSLFIDGVFNDSIQSPSKDTILNFNKELVNGNYNFYIGCYDTANNYGVSQTNNFTVDIRTFIIDLFAVACNDGATCTVTTINNSDQNYYGHGNLNNGNNYVYVNLSSPNIKAGSTIDYMNVSWEKFQETSLGSLDISWWNGNSWVSICTEIFVSSVAGSPDDVECEFLSYPTIDQINEGLQLRGNFFYSATSGGKAFETDFVGINMQYTEDTTPPAVSLTSPANNQQLGSGNITFEYIPSDVNLDNCTLYGDFSGSFSANETNANPSNSVTNSFTIYLNPGYYTWNVMCVDVAENQGFSATNRTVNITKPDLQILSEDITFSKINPVEFEFLNVSAYITNEGLTEAINFTVEFFYGNPQTTGVQFGSTQLINSLSGGQGITVNETYQAKAGPNDVYVRLDFSDNVDESSENNNLAFNTLDVSAYAIYYGNITKDIILVSSSNDALIRFYNITNNTGNVFISDYDDSINFGSLYALGRNINGQATTNDFDDADVLLGIDTFADSLSEVWASGTNTPDNTISVNAYGRTINNIPIINNSNTSEFYTGILWDASYDVADLQYSQDDKEPLVFYTRINSNTQGIYGFYDMEVKVPALLRNYSSGTDLVTFYVEIE